MSNKENRSKDLNNQDQQPVSHCLMFFSCRLTMFIKCVCFDWCQDPACATAVMEKNSSTKRLLKLICTFGRGRG